MPRPSHLAAVWSVSVAAALAAGGGGSMDKQIASSGDGGGAAAPAEAQSVETGDISKSRTSSASRAARADTRSSTEQA
jgi:hypothetical protein